VYLCAQEAQEGALCKSEGQRMNIHAFEVHSCTQRINREHGALWKVEGWSLRPPGCTHALKEGTFLLVEDVRSKEELVYGRA